MIQSIVQKYSDFSGTGEEALQGIHSDNDESSSTCREKQHNEPDDMCGYYKVNLHVAEILFSTFISFHEHFILILSQP